MAGGAEQEALLAAVAAMPKAWYAVADGALFDDLPSLLRSRGLTSYPLYLEASDGAGVRAGPHLVPLAELFEVRSLLDLLDGKPAAAFWSWPGDLASLRRHLRGLNLVEIPNERAGEPGKSEYEMVLFRHSDPRTLAAMRRVMTEDQEAKFVGAAAEIVYFAPEYGGLHRLIGRVRKHSLGRIRFEPSQIAQLGEVRLISTYDRIAQSIREKAATHAQRLSDSQLLTKVHQWEVEANAFGLTTEQEVGLWGLIQSFAGDTLADTPAVIEYFAEQQSHIAPGEKLLLLADEVCSKLQGA